MADIIGVIKQTANKFLNMYELETVHKSGIHGKYFLASRKKSIEELKLVSGKNEPDGVAIYALYGEKHDQVVLVHQYRYPIGRYVYEFPAGLVENGEDYHEAAIRELFEETGLTLHPIDAPKGYEKGLFTTVGMTDESCATVFGYCEGTLTTSHLEESEELEIVLVDREEAKRILAEEEVALQCGYMLMHFIADEEPFRFLEKA